MTEMRELTCDEIEQVSGGIIPILIGIAAIGGAAASIYFLGRLCGAARAYYEVAQ